MKEENAKKLFIFLMLLSIIISISMLNFWNTHKSVVCKQEGDRIICNNLAIVPRKCIIYYGNSSRLVLIKGLNKIVVNTNNKLLGWICQ